MLVVFLSELYFLTNYIANRPINCCATELLSESPIVAAMIPESLAMSTYIVDHDPLPAFSCPMSSVSHPRIINLPLAPMMEPYASGISCAVMRREFSEVCSS